MNKLIRISILQKKYDFLSNLRKSNAKYCVQGTLFHKIAITLTLFGRTWFQRLSHGVGSLDTKSNGNRFFGTKKMRLLTGNETIQFINTNKNTYEEKLLISYKQCFNYNKQMLTKLIKYFVIFLRKIGKFDNNVKTTCRATVLHNP